MCLVNHALGVVAELWWSLDYALAVMVKGEKRWKEKCKVHEVMEDEGDCARGYNVSNNIKMLVL